MSKPEPHYIHGIPTSFDIVDHNSYHGYYDLKCRNCGWKARDAGGDRKVILFHSDRCKEKKDAPA